MKTAEMFSRNPDWQVPEFEVLEFRPKSTRYCVAVFVVNEGERIRRQLAKMRDYSKHADIVVADGGSTDGSLDPKLLKKNDVRILLVKKGSGRLGAQMRMAFAYALSQGYEGVIVVDGNDKDDLSAIPRFVGALEAGLDHVQGSRFIRGGQAINTPLPRLLGTRLIHAPLISLAARVWYTDTTNGFRAYSARFLKDPRVAVFRDVLSGYEMHYYLAIKAARLGFKVAEIPVMRTYPKHGKIPTKISPWKGNLHILITLFKTVLGFYDPKSDG